MTPQHSTRPAATTGAGVLSCLVVAFLVAVVAPLTAVPSASAEDPRASLPADTAAAAAQRQVVRQAADARHPQTGWFQQSARQVDDATSDVVDVRTDAVVSWPQGDIVSARARVTQTSVRLALELADPRPMDPAVDDDWLGLTVAYLTLDTVGDGQVDHELFMYYDQEGQGATFDWVETATDRVVCRDVPRLVDGEYRLDDVAECIGGARPFTWDVTMAWDVDPPGAYVVDYLDYANDPPADFARAVPLQPMPRQRIAGGSRAETSVAVSQARFAGVVDRVLLANRDAFADALAAGAVDDSPVLLVPGCGPVPDVVWQEIQRLDPVEVVGVGGEAVLCEHVLDDAASLPDDYEPRNPSNQPDPEPDPMPTEEPEGPLPVPLPIPFPTDPFPTDPEPEPTPDPEPARRATARLAGPERFTTTVEVSRAAHAGPRPEVYIAGASAFPDAVSGAGEAPLLLVPSCDVVPDVVREEIRRLDPRTVIALGGEAVVCDEVLEDVAEGRDTNRYAGADRYETSAIVAGRGTRHTGPVVLASGESIVDALVAAGLPGPTVLLPPCGLAPRATVDRVVLQRGADVRVVGGTAALCDAVVVDIASS